MKLFFIVVFSAIFKSQRKEINNILKDVDRERIFRITSPRKLEKFVSDHFVGDSERVINSSNFSLGRS
jgi:hypothetical protein